ncbi:MAG: hypothetical protein GF355_15785 [Candidatus Eisenbacteria bacterium]|nr:hypothetical protein [Candidatus Eisenbacteria bacterium]
MNPPQRRTDRRPRTCGRGRPLMHSVPKCRVGCVWVLAVLLLVTAPAAGDIFPLSDYQDFAEEGSFDPAVPAPSEVLGLRVGARPLRHAEMLDYFRELAAATDRVLLQRYAESYEGRELFVVFVGTEENIYRLDEIRSDVEPLSDPRLANRAEQEELIDRLPAICWMAYTIHGDEMSGTDAAVALAYRLAAGEDAEARTIRENTLVIIDPLQNPDGRDRFITQMSTMNGRVPNSDTQSLAHQGHWPWGRTNHYLFDLNRDWFPLVHPETRGRVRLIAEWNPQLVVDGHEMGAFDTYLFSPPRAPFNPYMTDELLEWWDRFAADQATAFDRFGWSYYTREWNEEWYPGYGSSWCLYLGAVGILYEQAGTEGTLIKRPDGTVLTYGESVHHQYASSMANLMTAAMNRRSLLQDYAARRRSALEMGRKGSVKAYFFPPGADPGRTRRHMESLLLQGIEVDVARRPVSVKDLRDPWGGRWGARTLPPGTYRVSAAQPNARLLRCILDFHLQMPDSVFIEERDHLERQKGSRLYEITAWSTALAYGLPVYWSGSDTGTGFERVEGLAEPQGGLSGPGAAYGYVFDGSSDAAILAAARLATEGYVVRVGSESFTVNGLEFPRGSFLLRRDANPEDLETRLEEVARESGITIHGVSTALATRGPDLGGGRFDALREPRIAILADNPVNFNSVGTLWHLFDHEMQMRVSLLRTESVRELDLAKYNVIILPDAYRGGGAYRRVLGESGSAALRSWVEAGGTLVAVESAMAYAADTTTALSQVRQRREVLGDFPPPRWGLGPVAAAEAGRFQAQGVELKAEPAAETAEVSPPATIGLGIPGPGSPVLGPGAVPFAGEAGRGGAWTPPAATDPGLSAEEWTRVDERLRRFRPRGAFLRIDVDQDHWLTGGVPEKIPVLVSTSYAYVARDPVQTLARFAQPESLHVAGLLWPEAAGRLALSACVTRERLGRGQIIGIAVEPVFRGYVHGPKRFLLNAAILGPGLGTSQTVPW